MIQKYKKVYLLFVGAIFTGIVFGLFHYEYLLWQTRPSKPYSIVTIPSVYNKAFIFYQKNETWLKETASINVSSDLQEASFILIKEWLKILQSEQLIPHYVTLDSTLIDINEKNLYISFNASFFYVHHGTYQKLLLLVSLSKTIASLESSLQKYVLLVKDEPLIDTLIDCEAPFNIDYWITLY